MEPNCIPDKLAIADWRNERFSVSNPEDISRLNTIFKEMSPPERLRAFYCNQSLRDTKVLLTSSFGTTAVFLLHLFYRNNIRQPVHFLDTTYHFEETLAYKNQLARLFGLTIINLHPEEWKNKFTRENKLWETDPDLCCSVNKVEPMLTVKNQADVWVSGLMAWQNETRKNLDVFQWRDGVLKFYPIIDVTEEEAQTYLQRYDLPEHPLKPLGYESIGCKHCTFKGRGRAGRWAGQAKTECGLHK